MLKKKNILVMETKKCHIVIPSRAIYIFLSIILSIEVSYAQDTTCVDLGLSVKWAICNLGAESPEEYGDYYAWGEIDTKEKYTWANYKWCKGTVDSITKYYFKKFHGYEKSDNRFELEPEDDIAFIMLGGTWRMPTAEEFKELINNCTQEYATINGINGFKFTSKINGNYIFLPASGYFDSEGLCGVGNYGAYLSATLDPRSASHAEGLSFILNDPVTAYSKDGLIYLEHSCVSTKSCGRFI